MPGVPHRERYLVPGTYLAIFINAFAWDGKERQPAKSNHAALTNTGIYSGR